MCLYVRDCMHPFRAILLLVAALLAAACGRTDNPAAVAPTALSVATTPAAQPTPAENAPTAMPSAAASHAAPPTLGTGRGQASSVSPLAARTPIAAAPRPSPAPGAPQIITPEDGKEAIELSVGAAIELKLTKGLEWTIAVDERILAPDPAAPYVYRAVAPGTAQLVAEGSPTCAKATPPCAMPARLLTLQIVVR
jgi:hypothetical protein